MRTLKIFSLITVVLFLIGIAMINSAVAGEQIKVTQTSINTKWHQLEAHLD